MVKYQLSYSAEALRDLRDIFEYIAFELKEPATARAQVGRIRDNIRSLDAFPKRNRAIDWEPWVTRGVRQMPVDNFIVYYIPDDNNRTVHILRIFYGKRDIPNLVKNEL